MEMMENNKHIEILKSWDKMTLPKPGAKMMLQYYSTNLWIFKTSDKKFGFLISGTIGQLKYNYKNILTSWQPHFIDNKNNIKLENCLVIEASKNIDSKLFCTNISSLFEIQDKNHLFKVHEIEEALRKIEDITLKQSDEFNQVIGVWGELYLINEFIKITKSEEGKLELIESWEGVETRSKIDFNFKSRKTKIEVKTTIEPIRIHHLNGLDQVSVGPNFKGFLASFCINPDDEGITCNDLVNNIKRNIPKAYLSVFESKLTIRGNVCYNTKYQFVINSSKELQFFDFDRVPKPMIEDGVGKIQWDAVLENKQFIDLNDKNNLLNLMN
jgi:hypothetical protein